MLSFGAERNVFDEIVLAYTAVLPVWFIRVSSSQIVLDVSDIHD